MLTIGQEVKHKVFGVGTVSGMNGKYLTVAFQNTEKVFVYPDAFEKFLTLSDGTVSNEILEDLNHSMNRREQIRMQKHEENLRAMQKGIVIPGKEMTVENTEDGSEKHQEEI